MTKQGWRNHHSDVHKEELNEWSHPKWCINHKCKRYLISSYFLGFRIWLLNFAGGNHPFSWIQSHRVELSVCLNIEIHWKINSSPLKRERFLDRKKKIHHLGPTIYREGPTWGQSRCAWKNPNSFWWFGIQDAPNRSDSFLPSMVDPCHDVNPNKEKREEWFRNRSNNCRISTPDRLGDVSIYGTNTSNRCSNGCSMSYQIHDIDHDMHDIMIYH